MLSLSAKEIDNIKVPVAAPLDRLHTYSVEEQEVEEKVEKQVPEGTCAYG